MKLTKEYIRVLLGNKIYYRALEYYREGRVNEIKIASDNRLLWAEVKGSGRNLYKVEVEFKKNGEIKDAFCDCPYPYLCKHIGAVLLEYIELNEKNFVNIGSKNPLDIKNPFINKEERKNAYNDIVIRLKDTGETEHPIFQKLKLIDFSTNQIKSTSNPTEQGFRLIFVIEKNLSHYSAGYANWILRPALQYIRLDGKAGRVERYNPSKLTYPISEKELTILSIIERYDERKVPFEYLIDYFISENENLDNHESVYKLNAANPNQQKVEVIQNERNGNVLLPLPLYIKKEKYYEPVHFSKINSINLKFIFYSLMVNRDNEPLFKPLINFYDNNKEVTTIKDPYSIGSSSRTFFIVDRENNKILYQKENFFSYQNIIENLLKIDVGYTYSDVKRLENIINKRFVNSIKFDFPTKQVKILNLRPKTILTLRDVFEGLEIGIMFKYSYTNNKNTNDNEQINLEESKFGENDADNNTNKSINKHINFTRVIPSSLKSDILILNEKNDGSTEEIIITWRDKRYEKAILNYVINLFDEDMYPYYSRFRGRSYFSWQMEELDPDKEKIILNKDIDYFLVKYGERLLSEGFELRKNGKKITTVSKIVFTANWGIDWLDIKTEFQSSDGETFSFDPMTDVLDGKFIKANDTYILLDKEHIEKLKSLYEHGSVQKDSMRMSRYDLSIIDELYQDLKNKDEENIKRIKKIINGLKKFDGIKNIKLPSSFSGRLRKYQQAGLNWLYFLNKYGLNGILADDMGLGKTIQALALILTLKDQKRFERALIVAPVSTLSNWINEITRFTPSLNKFLYHGTSRQAQIDNINSNDIIVTSYGTLRNDIALLSNYNFTYLILDESQMVKNPISKSYKSVRLINAEYRLSLTGTPVENSTVDLWAQMNFLNPGLLGTLTDFKRKFAKPIEKDHDKSKSELLKRIIFPFILRRKKEDVLKELPPKEEIILYATMDKKQKQIYEKIRQFYKNKVKQKIENSGLNKSSIVIFEALLKLRQAAILPSLISNDYNNIPSCKLELLKLKIGEVLAEDHKALIFSQFRGSLSEIRKWIKSLNVDFTYLDGSTKNREEVIRAFQEDDSKKIFIISLKAGGLGINLTASNYVFLFDPWWNPAVEMQAVDRSHRIGQPNKVTIYKLITKDTIEEKIIVLQDKKRNLVNDIITTEKAFFKSLNKQEIMSLFDSTL